MSKRRSLESTLLETHGCWDSIYEYLDYLKNSLIPDLLDSGAKEAAEDFQDAVSIIKFLKEQQ